MSLENLSSGNIQTTDNYSVNNLNVGGVFSLKGVNQGAIVIELSGVSPSFTAGSIFTPTASDYSTIVNNSADLSFNPSTGKITGFKVGIYVLRFTIATTVGFAAASNTNFCIKVPYKNASNVILASVIGSTGQFTIDNIDNDDKFIYFEGPIVIPSLGCYLDLNDTDVLGTSGAAFSPAGVIALSYNIHRVI